MKTTLLLILSLLYIQPVFSQSNPLLEKYRSMALKYNHDLKAAEKNISTSLELEKSARANQKPKLGADANFQYTGHPAELALPVQAASKPLRFKGSDMQYGTSVSLSQPVYTGKRILESIRLAQHQQSVATNQAEIIRSSVCYQTDIQYWNTVARQEIVNVTSNYYNSITSLATTIRERVDAGLVDAQDLLMAEVKQNEAQYLLLQAQSDFETGRMAFNSLVGIELQKPTEIEYSIPVVTIPDSLLWKTGLNRPEIKMAQDKIKIAESTLQLNDSYYKPQLYVGIDGSYSSPGYNFHSDLDLNYSAYAKVSVPLFEWGKRRSEKRAAAEQIGMATDNLNQVKDNVVLEVETAKVALQQAMKRVDLSKNSLEKARENEKKALEKYSEGNISILEVIDAQTYYQTSQLNYVQSKISAQCHYADLIKASNAYNSL